MSSPNKRRLKLEELRAQGTEALGMVPGFEIELDDGSTVNVPNPMLVADDTQELIDASKSSVDTAKAILGADEHARFIAAGGHSNDVLLAWRLMTEDMKTDPKLPR
ncbi:MAG: hypothetical protein ACRDRN_26480 [Sciscionella sp.]